MLKIAMITTCYQPVINGVVRMIELYREQLTALGHRVTIFTFGGPSDQDGEHTVRIPAVPLGKTGYYFRRRFPNHIIELLNQFDMVHCHHLFMGPELLADKLKPPIVYTNHTRYDLYTEVYLPLPKIIRKPVAKRLIRHLWSRNTAGCAAVIAPSQHVANVMRSFGVVVPIEVIHNGVQLANFTAAKPIGSLRPNRSLTGVYVGRLAAEKNILPLLDRLVEVCQQNETVRFRLVGHGPLHDACQRIIAKHQLDQQIILEGWVSKESIPSILASADFQVTMSVSEVHPLGIIEGMAAGLSTVAQFVYAMSECVGEAGLLAQNRTDWISGVHKLIDSAELRQTLGAKAKEQARKYAIEQTVLETIELYKKLMANRTME